MPLHGDMVLKCLHARCSEYSPCCYPIPSIGAWDRRATACRSSTPGDSGMVRGAICGGSESGYDWQEQWFFAKPTVSVFAFGFGSGSGDVSGSEQYVSFRFVA